MSRKKRSKGTEAKSGQAGFTHTKAGIALALIAEAVGQGLASGTVEKGVEEVLKLLNDHPAAQSEKFTPKKDLFSRSETLHDFRVTTYDMNGTETTFNRSVALREALASSYTPESLSPVISDLHDDASNVVLKMQFFSDSPAIEIAIPKDRLMSLWMPDGRSLSDGDVQSLKQISITPQQKAAFPVTFAPPKPTSSES